MTKPVQDPGTNPGGERRAATGLRLYVARGTPNSDRAETNLGVALLKLDGAGAQMPVEIVDVFSDPKRALKDGIIATPTLIGFCVPKRQVIMGDLTDSDQLTSF